jgi:hypothetical protein
MIRLLLILIWLPLFGRSQELVEFNTSRLNLDKKLMIGLGAWSISNLAVSSYGWAKTDNEANYFHQMNVMWSGINLALAIPGYIKAMRTNPQNFTFAQTWKTQIKTEKIFLFNTALDVCYMSAGLYLKQKALTSSTNYHRFRGFGNSLLLQGGFLFLFDLTATILHTNHRNEKLNGFLEKIEPSDNGIGLKFGL